MKKERKGKMTKKGKKIKIGERRRKKKRGGGGEGERIKKGGKRRGEKLGKMTEKKKATWR